MTYIYLAIAIISEVIATSTLKASAEFTRFWPSLIVIIGFLSALYFMTLVLRVLPIGLTYAIWSGLGIVLVTISGMIFYKQIPDLAAIIGMALIVAGVVVIRLFSNFSAH